MKKASLFLSGLTTNAILLFTNVSQAHADMSTNITIGTVKSGIKPSADIGKVLGNAVSIIFVVATLLVLFFLIIGAFNWITSGGDKERVGKARGTILNALIGLAVLALAFVIWTLVGRIVNVDTNNLALPSLDNGA